METVRREFIKIGADLAVNFANTVFSPGGDPTGSLPLLAPTFIDFLELRGGLAARRWTP